MKALAGYKTYILGSCGILYAVFGFVAGHVDLQTAIGIVFASLTAMGIRNGITTEIQSLTAFLPNKQLPPVPPQS